MLLAVPGSRAFVLLLLLIDLCDRTTIFQSQPRLFLQRLPLRLLFLQRLALRLLFLQRAALRLLLLLRLLSIRTSTTSATAILWLRACSGHSLSLSLLFLCNHTTGSLSAHLTGSPANPVSVDHQVFHLRQYNPLLRWVPRNTFLE